MQKLTPTKRGGILRCLNERNSVLSTGLDSYRFAVGLHFPDSDFAQLVKIYGRDEQGPAPQAAQEKPAEMMS